MQKILLINNGYPSIISPQYSTYIKSMQDCMVEAGLSVELLVLNTNYKTKTKKIINYIKYYRALMLVDCSAYDVVYINNYPYSFLPLVFKFRSINKLIIHWHGTDIVPPSLFSKALNHLSYLFIPKSTRHFAPSRYFSGVISRKLKVDKNRIFITPSGGVDTELFQSSRLKSTGKAVTLGFCSSMRADKGIDDVVQLMRKCSDIEEITGKSIRLLCIKYGVEKDHYCSILSKYKNARLIDPLPKNQMVRYYQEIDILLLPTRMAESLALVGLEAMSSNVPVVGTDDFAIKDYVIGRVSGEKFEKGNMQSFFNAVTKTIVDIEKYHPRDIVCRGYSRDFVISQYKEYFGASNG